MLHRKDLSRVKEVWFCAEEDRRIDRSDVVKGYEMDDGRYVVVEDEELKKIAPATATTMDILQFVDNDEVDPIFFESSYYIASEDKAAKPYALFTAALEATKQDAIAKIAMHNREHVVLIRPSGGGLLLHTLFYPNELHETNRSQAPRSKFTGKELELAKGLIQQMKAPFDAQEFTDEYRENVERLMAEKQKGRKVTSIRHPRKAPVIDLMEALRRSIRSGSGKAAAKGHARSAARKPAVRRKAG